MNDASTAAAAVVDTPDSLQNADTNHAVQETASVSSTGGASMKTATSSYQNPTAEKSPFNYSSPAHVPDVGTSSTDNTSHPNAQDHVQAAPHRSEGATVHPPPLTGGVLNASANMHVDTQQGHVPAAPAGHPASNPAARLNFSDILPAEDDSPISSPQPHPHPSTLPTDASLTSSSTDKPITIDSLSAPYLQEGGVLRLPQRAQQGPPAVFREAGYAEACDASDLEVSVGKEEDNNGEHGHVEHVSEGLGQLPLKRPHSFEPSPSQHDRSQLELPLSSPPVVQSPSQPSAVRAVKGVRSVHNSRVVTGGIRHGLQHNDAELVPPDTVTSFPIRSPQTSSPVSHSSSTVRGAPVSPSAPRAAAAGSPPWRAGRPTKHAPVFGNSSKSPKIPLMPPIEAHGNVSTDSAPIAHSHYPAVRAKRHGFDAKKSKALSTDPTEQYARNRAMLSAPSGSARTSTSPSNTHSPDSMHATHALGSSETQAAGLFQNPRVLAPQCILRRYAMLCNSIQVPVLKEASCEASHGQHAGATKTPGYTISRDVSPTQGDSGKGGHKGPTNSEATSPHSKGALCLLLLMCVLSCF